MICSETTIHTMASFRGHCLTNTICFPCYCVLHLVFVGIHTKNNYIKVTERKAIYLKSEITIFIKEVSIMVVLENKILLYNRNVIFFMFITKIE